MTRLFALVILVFLNVVLGGCGDRDANHAQQSVANKGADANNRTTPDPDKVATADPDKQTSATPDPDKSGNSGAQNVQSNIPVQIGVARFTAVPTTISAFGTVSGGANSQVSLAFPEAGRISRIYVSVGSHVEAGQVLAQLDTRPFAADAAQAAAALQVAQANYTKTAAGARPQQVAQTNAQISAAQTQLSLARAQLSRQEQLLKLGIASKVDVDSARNGVSTAQSSLQVLQQQQSAQVNPYQPDVSASRAGVAQAQAALAAAQQRVAFASLIASVTGTVVGRLHNEGESVDPTTPVIQIANGESQVFTAQFSPEDAQKVHRGDLATITAQGTNDSVTGHVIAINVSQTTDARTVAVLIRLDHQSPALGPGAYGNASIRVGSHRGLVVPTVSIVSDPTTGSSQVFRKDGDRFTPVPVTVHQRFGSLTWVDSPNLHNGDRVATQGAYELIAPPRSGQKDPDAK